MSKKNKESKPIPTAAGPRKAEEIRQEYFQLVARSGELHYQIEIFNKELKGIHGRLEAVNYEMDARNKLDKAVEAEQQAKAATAAAEQAKAAVTQSGSAPADAPAPVSAPAQAPKQEVASGQA